VTGEVLRTPKERFRNLPGYPFRAHYVDVGGLRMHYVDEGGGQVVLCLHGEPTWSYLYRKVISGLCWKYRVIAPDFVGFGKSDKYALVEAYSLRRHLDQLKTLVRSLDLNEVTLVCHDWGGLVGLSLVAEEPARFFRLVIMNTGLPVGEPVNEAFTAWREYALRTPDLPVGRVVARACPGMEPEVAAAYDAPFPDVRFKGGVRSVPALVPLTPDAPGAVELARAREALSVWSRPTLVLFSDRDPITAGGADFFTSLIPSSGAPVLVQGAGHFLQEQRGEEVADRITSFILRNPPPSPTKTFQPSTFW